jgi:hypothetical protein
MEYLLIMLVAFCVIAIVLGRAVPHGRWLVVIGATLIVYSIVLIAWWFALYFQLVPVDRTLAALGIYRTEGWPGALIFFGPPLVATLAVVIVASQRKRAHKSGRGK